MPKTKISEFSATPGNNTDIDGINIAEGCAPSGINDAIRELMAQLKDFQAGTAGDSFNGPIGSTTPAAGAFTTLSASGTTTLSGLTASTALALDASKNVISVTNTGTGNNVLSASPTFTGTVNAAALTLSGSQTLSAGTANGIAFLNGSKVLTTGSALSFDGTNLGVGTSTPNTAGYGGSVIGVYGSGNNGGNLWITSDTQTDSQRTGRIGFGTEGNTTNKETARIWSVAEGTTATNIGGQLRFNTKADGGALAERYRITADGTSLWSVAGSEAMRLTSTGLGIGTSSPTARLVVQQANNTGDGIRLFANGNDSQLLTRYLASIDAWQVSASFASTGAYKPITWFTSDAERMRLDTSGNLGLGVTPAAWSGVRGFDIGTGANAAVASNSTGAYFTLNSYFNGTNWIYKGTSQAAYYAQVNGVHSWYTAPSGTAGTAISFTQALTLNASGNLLLGTTSDPGGVNARAVVDHTGSNYALTLNTTTSAAPSILLFRNSNANGEARLQNGTGGALTFWGSNSAESARITSGGQLLINSTTDGAAAGARLHITGNTLQSAASIRIGTDGYPGWYFTNSAGTKVGDIVINTASTTYNTTSSASTGAALVQQGVQFPATQSASSDANTLDDYEQGTWTPSVGGTATYTTQVGRYTKVGRMVYVQAVITIGTIGTGSTTIISGLPFPTSLQQDVESAIMVAWSDNIATSVVSFSAFAISSNIHIRSRTAAAASASTNAIFGNAATIEIGGWYQAAD